MELLIKIIIFAFFFSVAIMLGADYQNRWWIQNQRYNSTFIQSQKEDAIEVYELCRDSFHGRLDECREAGITEFSPRN